jgi:ATP-dependent Clp protease protease subunit
MVIETSGKNIERSFDIFSRNLRDRNIFITGAIETHMAQVIVAQVLFLQAEDPKAPINIFVNSEGGSVYSGLSIYSSLRHCTCPIHVYGMGLCASMGALLLQAGDVRNVLPYTTVMIHSVSGGTGRATVWDAEIQMDEMIRLNNELTDIFVKRNTKGKSFEELKNIMSRDHYLTPEQALDLGLIDNIVEPKK